jgi:hypothetical protein
MSKYGRWLTTLAIPMFVAGCGTTTAPQHEQPVISAVLVASAQDAAGDALALSFARRAMTWWATNTVELEQRGFNVQQILRSLSTDIGRLEARDGTKFDVMAETSNAIVEALTGTFYTNFSVYTSTNAPATISHSGTINWNGHMGSFSGGSSSSGAYVYSTNHVTSCPTGTFTVTSSHAATYDEGSPSSDSTASYASGSCSPAPE